MKAAVIVFPGSNCDRDVYVALSAAMGEPAEMVWHGEASLPEVGLVVLPGGFSYGDYLRAGSMAAESPIMRDVVDRAGKGLPVLGICNGFQVLTEARLLPGALIRNRGLKFVCRDIHLRVEQPDGMFTSRYEEAQVIRLPIAHHEGNFFADEETVRQLEAEDRVALRYCDENGNATDESNPNGSANNIAGILNERGNVMGMMPHPERLFEDRLGGHDGMAMFESLVEAIQ